MKIEQILPRLNVAFSGQAIRHLFRTSPFLNSLFVLVHGLLVHIDDSFVITRHCFVKKLLLVGLNEQGLIVAAVSCFNFSVFGEQDIEGIVLAFIQYYLLVLH